jgi:membrane peptidoglycan carboxypeptidase
VAPSSRRRTWATIGKLVGILLATGILAAGLMLPYVGGLGLAARHEADKFLTTACNLAESSPPQATTLYARDDKTVVARIFTQDRQPISISDVPQYLQDALVATEDRRFFSHHGVDMRGLIRSAVSTSGGDTQGGSTLTMQYVKQIRYYQAGDDIQKQQAAIAQNLNRKIEDAKCALDFEKREGKQQILENYLNIAFFGENSYGIEKAAETFFGISAKDLTLPQSALLVGALRAPSSYDPFIHPEAAKQRRNDVIQNLVDVGKLSQAQANQYKATPVSLSTASPPPIKQTCANSTSSIPNVGFFCDYVVNWLTTTGGVDHLDTSGLNVQTTIDPNLQASAQAQISAAMPSVSPTTAVLPVVDPRTGDVLAMVTSKRYGNKTSEKDVSHTTLPIFTDYTASGASTYKLFPLLTALSTGLPSTWALGTPANNGPYTPTNCVTDAAVTNADAKVHYSPNETLATATAKSSNTYFVELVDQLLGCNLQPVVDLAKKLGINGLDNPSGEGTATIGQAIVDNGRAAQLVLGAIGTSPMEITGAYAAVANDGMYNAPSPVISIKDSQGNQVRVNRPTPVQVVSPQVARQAVQILTGDTVSTGTSAGPFASWYAVNQSPVAGKTGTSVAVVNGKDSTQNASLWFVGMTPKYVATSALINFDHPNDPVAGLPGVTDPGVNAYGEYASGIWLKALQPSLQTQTWAWPSPLAVEGSPVPIHEGMTMADANAAAKAAGYTLQQLDFKDGVTCPSSAPYGTVAYYGPQIAAKGSTITVCPSSNFPQQTNAPKPTPTKTKIVPGSSTHASSSAHSRTRTTPHSSHAPAPSSSASATSQAPSTTPATTQSTPTAPPTS